MPAIPPVEGRSRPSGGITLISTMNLGEHMQPCPRSLVCLAFDPCDRVYVCVFDGWSTLGLKRGHPVCCVAFRCRWAEAPKHQTVIEVCLLLFITVPLSLMRCPLLLPPHAITNVCARASEHTLVDKKRECCEIQYFVTLWC